MQSVREKIPDIESLRVKFELKKNEPKEEETLEAKKQRIKEELADPNSLRSQTAAITRQRWLMAMGVKVQSPNS